MQQVNSSGGQQSNTALHLAAGEGYLDCCQALVAAGANVNSQNAQEDTPLILASLHGHLPIVRFLLQHQASIRKRGYHERTALHCAAEGGHLSLCRSAGCCTFRTKWGRGVSFFTGLKAVNVCNEGLIGQHKDTWGTRIACC